MAIRTGYALPMGKVLDSTGVSDMSDFVSAQVPVIFDIGGKVIPEVFVGGYLGFAFGGAAGFEETRCGTNCASARLILGIEAQYHILPAGQMNPWLGYGIGLESTAVGGKIAGEDESVAFAGWEFAHFMGGLDVRLSRVFGIGPFVDFSLGSYSTQSTKSQGVTRNFDVNQTALHEWFTIGARGVFFP